MTSPLSATVLIEALDEPALIVEGGRIMVANSAARLLFGQAIVGRDIRFAIRHPQALEAIVAGTDRDLALVGLANAGQPWQLSVRSIGPSASFVRATDRSVAVAAERMRVDFVANASHELRTPLATISGFAETLAEQGPLDDRSRAKFGATIHDEAARMLGIIEDLMGLSRIEADRFIAPRETVDLAAVARIAAQQVAGLAERKACAIDLLTGDRPVAVLGDHAQLVQVVDNLLTNAIRYGCRARDSAVRVEVMVDGARGVLRVIDQGDGVAADLLPRLTERFYRVDPARSRESGGTGLGLAIVKHIVERHRGTLDIRSKIGVGTTIEVRLPIPGDN